MASGERRAAFEAMTPCSVCGEKHLGPRGRSRCAADPTAPLPEGLHAKVSARRYAHIMALRSGSYSDS
eukprot:7380220-Prymnesium_polylepis.1